ncbi:MoxR family ATPase (plasmid) [Pseudonocardia sp. DSM 110487]|uniref:AAA family ATPase n=1 Tax=Pseudonocardia sp. DSM 110487 TaxID=2865833 RepID=UPI001C6966AE|nr:MoxR family ATPase [Pseudonocardia sp. DSM 110487]QYN41105.1 MoxR family ATPase [Pseudonocardia sp. DSM 110487]
MADWQIYTGTAEPHRAAIPAAPPWRTFGDPKAGHQMELPAPESESETAATFQATGEMVDAVNAALVLRRPLLLTGRPGSGKSSLIDSVARELELGRVLRWHVTSASTLTDALYRYDAIGRLQAHGLRREQSDGRVVDAPEIEDYLRLGPLGTALLPSLRPRALLIDEIDKSDIDLPNDLLNVFERGEFDVPELARMGTGPVDVRVDGGDESYPIENGRVRCTEFPFVVLTSNGERDFPAAFLRRCIRLRMPDPTVTLLTDIMIAHLGAVAAAESDALIKDFATRAKADRAYATDQLMNAVFMVTGDGTPPGEEERARMVELLLKKLATDVV